MVRVEIYCVEIVLVKRVFFIERYKYIEEYANGTLEKFQRFFTIGGVH